MSSFYVTYKNREWIRGFPYCGKNPKHQGKTLVEIYTKYITFRGRKFRDLDSSEKRKFENLIFIEHSNERLKFRYI